MIALVADVDEFVDVFVVKNICCRKGDYCTSKDQTCFFGSSSLSPFASLWRKTKKTERSPLQTNCCCFGWKHR